MANNENNEKEEEEYENFVPVFRMGIVKTDKKKTPYRVINQKILFVIM